MKDVSLSLSLVVLLLIAARSSRLFLVQSLVVGPCSSRSPSRIFRHPPEAQRRTQQSSCERSKHTLLARPQTYIEYEEEDDGYYPRRPNYQSYNDDGGWDNENQRNRSPLTSTEAQLRNMRFVEDVDDEEESSLAPLFNPDVNLDRRRPVYDDDGGGGPNQSDRSPGNFWSNPVDDDDDNTRRRRAALLRQQQQELPGYDPNSRLTPQQSQSQQQPPQSSLSSSSSSYRRRGLPPPSSLSRRRTTFRSGEPEAPEPVKDFYNRLFWFGFDASDNLSPADRTMFGGTKGKFNGLSYLDGQSPRQRQRRPRPPRLEPAETTRRIGEYDDYDDNYNDNYDDDDDEEWDNPESRLWDGTAQQPPLPSSSYDVLQYEQLPRSQSTRKRRRRREPPPPQPEDDDGGVTDQVLSWFRNNGGDDDNDDGYNNNNNNNNRNRVARGGGRRRSTNRGGEEGSFDVLGAFFGLNQERLSRQADEYNKSMGLDSNNNNDNDGMPPSRRRRQQQQRRRRRPGYAYPYDKATDDENDEPPVADVRVVADASETPESTVVDSAQKKEIAIPKLSWEERSLALERVPPSNVLAWGPSGALAIDARTKAIHDALQDVEEAKRDVVAKEEMVADSREELSILRVDMELEKAELFQSRMDRRRVEKELQAMDETIDEAARSLRHAQMRLEMALKKRDKVERRHWAVLQFINHGGAEEPAANQQTEQNLEEDAVDDPKQDT